MGEKAVLSDVVAKDRILKRISGEGIRIRPSFSKSATGQYTYYLGEDKIPPTIEVPQFTDLSELIQAFALAHELGHHYVYQKSSGKKARLIKSGLLFTTYWNEKLAWRQAEQILKEEGILVDEQTNCSFLMYKTHCLNTYKDQVVHSISSPFKFLFDSVLLLIKLYIGLYILLGIGLVFSANSIPIPFDDFLGISFLNKNELLSVVSKLVYIVLSLATMYKFCWCYFLRRSFRPVLFYFVTLFFSKLVPLVF